MRSIRLSKEMKKEILDKLSKSYSSRIKEIQDVLDRNALNFYNTMYSEAERHAASVLGKKWLQHTKSLSFKIKYNDKVFGPVEVALPTDLPASDDQTNWYTRDNAVFELAPHKQDVKAWEAEVILALEKRDKLIAERKNLMANIEKIYDSCSTTVNLAAVWPSFVDYISDATKQKLFAVKERKTSKRLQKTVVIDDQTQILLAKSRILNGA